MIRHSLKDRNNEGFTLIEIMVAISIFVIVAFITTTTLLVVLDANRRANAWRSIMENVNFAVDSMSYKIKFGSNYQIFNGVNTTPVDKGDRIEFIDRDQKRISYCKRGVGKQAIYRCDFTNKPGTENCITSDFCQPITSTDIDIIEIKITKAACDKQCPTNKNEAIVLAVRAEVTIKKEVSELDFQTTVSQSRSR